MNNSLRFTVYASLFTALIVVGGYLSLPLPFSPVPIALADFFAIMAGITLGAPWGGASVGIFIFLGCLGMPVFAQGKAGLGVLFGPTGGFVAGYLLGAALAGWVVGRGKPSRGKDAVAIGLGFTAVFAVGLIWLGISPRIGWGKAVAAGLLPFLPGTLIKMVGIWLTAPRLRNLTRKS
jgi:biotin transport system substrate-specific component